MLASIPANWQGPHLVLFATIAWTAFFAPASAAEPSKPRAKEPPKVNVTEQSRAVAQSSNQFAFDLYGQLRRQEGNLFFSPASISTALAMADAGAAGETRRQMDETLHFELPPDDLNAGFAALSQLLHSRGDKQRLSMANRLWGQKSYAFRPEFLETTRRYFGAELASLDFARSEQARRTINAWVEEQTQGKIADLIPPGVLDATTRLVLTNAIYFKGAWEHEFTKQATRDEAFHLSKQQETKAPMMRQTHEFRYAETPEAQILELPYAGGELAMVLLLPKAIDGLPELETQLSQEKVDKWLAKLKSRDVQTLLPRFKLTSQFQLSETLRTLGMALAFSDQADFSGISAQEGLKITAVVHKAFVDVNEEGTEAAAATGVVFGPTAAPVREKPVVFRADHPFIFLIRDRRTGAMLFVGRVVDPT